MISTKIAFYSLHEVLVHTGSHYYTLIRQPDGTFSEFNDDSVSRAITLCQKKDLNRARFLRYVRVDTETGA